MARPPGIRRWAGVGAEGRRYSLCRERHAGGVWRQLRFQGRKLGVEAVLLIVGQAAVLQSLLIVDAAVDRGQLLTEGLVLTVADRAGLAPRFELACDPRLALFDVPRALAGLQRACLGMRHCGAPTSTVAMSAAAPNRLAVKTFIDRLLRGSVRLGLGVSGCRSVCPRAPMRCTAIGNLCNAEKDVGR